MINTYIRNQTGSYWESSTQSNSVTIFTSKWKCAFLKIRCLNPFNLSGKVKRLLNLVHTDCKRECCIHEFTKYRNGIGKKWDTSKVHKTKFKSSPIYHTKMNVLGNWQVLQINSINNFTETVFQLTSANYAFGKPTFYSHLQKLVCRHFSLNKYTAICLKKLL